MWLVAIPLDKVVFLRYSALKSLVQHMVSLAGKNCNGIYKISLTVEKYGND